MKIFQSFFQFLCFGCKHAIACPASTCWFFKQRNRRFLINFRNLLCIYFFSCQHCRFRFFIRKFFYDFLIWRSRLSNFLLRSSCFLCSGISRRNWTRILCFRLFQSKTKTRLWDSYPINSKSLCCRILSFQPKSFRCWMISSKEWIICHVFQYIISGTMWLIHNSCRLTWRYICFMR